MKQCDFCKIELNDDAERCGECSSTVFTDLDGITEADEVSKSAVQRFVSFLRSEFWWLVRMTPVFAIVIILVVFMPVLVYYDVTLCMVLTIVIMALHDYLKFIEKKYGS